MAIRVCVLVAKMMKFPVNFPLNGNLARRRVRSRLRPPGDLLRIRLRKRKMLKLKVRQTVGKAYTPAEKDQMLKEARKARSPSLLGSLKFGKSVRARR